MFISDEISYHLSFLAYPEPGQMIFNRDVYVTIYTINGEEDNLTCTDVVGASTFDIKSCIRWNPIANKVSKFGMKINVIPSEIAPSEDIGMLIQQGKDVSVAIQDELLGNEYVILNHCPIKSNCQFAITSVGIMTLVEIVVPFEIQVNVTCEESSDIRLIKAMVPISFNLSEYDTLLLETDRDLSGVRVKADRNIAVIAGSHVDEQYRIEMMQPVNRWGVEYIVVLINSEKDIMKIVTAFDDTKLEINNLGPIVLGKAGFRYIRPMTSPYYHVKANKPIGVLYVSPGMGTMVQIPPLKATRTTMQMVFLSDSVLAEMIIAGVFENCGHMADLSQMNMINVTPTDTLMAGAVRETNIDWYSHECTVVSGVKFQGNYSHYLDPAWIVTDTFAVC